MSWCRRSCRTRSLDGRPSDGVRRRRYRDLLRTRRQAESGARRARSAIRVDRVAWRLQPQDGASAASASVARSAGRRYARQDLCGATAERPAVSADSAWQYGGFVDVGYLRDFNEPSNHLFRSRGTAFHVNEWDLNMAGGVHQEEGVRAIPVGHRASASREARTRRCSGFRRRRRTSPAPTGCAISASRTCRTSRRSAPD